MTIPSHTETVDLARRVESARARLDDLLTGTAEEPAPAEVLQILHEEDLIDLADRWGDLTPASLVS